ncbi:MAG TPA: alpha/beta fold hydrolase [Gemmatimonadaceae bacterium]|nr:alpha/beta fold hydrolase [Gemmatimonadaceae bacterium]
MRPLSLTLAILALIAGSRVAAAQRDAVARGGDTSFTRADAQHDMALLMKIRNPHGVQSLEQVTLGGSKQWISIRGTNRDNPLMLFIHGGPGDAMMTREWAFQRPWEDFFTVVQWDQRGGGKNALADTSKAMQATFSVARDVADAEELVALLRQRFGKQKIVIVGHSFGTVIGSELAARHPDWVSVYVGIGQASPNGESMLYDDVLALAHAAKNATAVAQLDSMKGYPNVPGAALARDVATLRRWSRFFGGAWYGDQDWSAYSAIQWLGPEYTDAEMRAFGPAEGRVTARVLSADFFGQDAKLARHFDVPVVFMMGRHDLHTPYSAAKRYFDSLTAPSKRFVTFEESAHVPFLEEPGHFLEALLRDVQPLAAERAEAWTSLFDGKTLSGWHGLGYEKTPPGLWVVEDGAIVRVPNGRAPVQADGQPLTGMDLISDRAFRDFELSWEWKIAPGGNSGLKYNVSESLSTHMDPPHAAKGWEYQMLDDSLAEDNKLATHRTGALYDMFASSEPGATRPAGEWNSSRLIFVGNHGEHWLNGVKVVSFDLGTPAFDSAFAKSKYAKYPSWFPIRRAGQIVLQDHDAGVWFRNIKIREIK